MAERVLLLFVVFTAFRSMQCAVAPSYKDFNKDSEETSVEKHYVTEPNDVYGKNENAKGSSEYLGYGRDVDKYRKDKEPELAKPDYGRYDFGGYNRYDRNYYDKSESEEKYFDNLRDRYYQASTEEIYGNSDEKSIEEYMPMSNENVGFAGKSEENSYEQPSNEDNYGQFDFEVYGKGPRYGDMVYQEEVDDNEIYNKDDADDKRPLKEVSIEEYEPDYEPKDSFKKVPGFNHPREYRQNYEREYPTQQLGHVPFQQRFPQQYPPSARLGNKQIPHNQGYQRYPTMPYFPFGFPPFYGFPYGYFGFPYNYGGNFQQGYRYNPTQQPRPQPPTIPAPKPRVNVRDFKCPTDGYFYREPNSFFHCYGGDHNVQFCAPGSMNFESSFYLSKPLGYKYDMKEFCSVNMVPYAYPPPAFPAFSGFNHAAPPTYAPVAPAAHPQPAPAVHTPDYREKSSEESMEDGRKN